ncbi:BrnA antitoxin family protein [Paraburkholderia sp. BL6669N2]|uniref:BrnA antitoxin family protein n=1 Tax=Paraburkholderia sp. BL6669N2 TaxID=1938807 RepID=UPI0021620A66
MSREVLTDADIVAAFRETGDGWETRMNDALRAFLKEHPLDTNNASRKPALHMGNQEITT